ncbi:MAG: hypothetical protein Q7R41_12320, partial [Phycisphaerales bacterium]|nr:hypothetical protein [Phycisphaerales bacterium]
AQQDGHRVTMIGDTTDITQGDAALYAVLTQGDAALHAALTAANADGGHEAVTTSHVAAVPLPVLAGTRR